MRQREKAVNMRRSLGVSRSGDHEAYEERILGSGEFVESLWREIESNEISDSKKSLEEIIQSTSDTFGIDARLLRQRNRIKELVDARAAICYLSVREFGFNCVEVARSLNMSRSGVSVAIKRGCNILTGNPTLRAQLIDKAVAVGMAVIRHDVSPVKPSIQSVAIVFKNQNISNLKREPNSIKSRKIIVKNDGLDRGGPCGRLFPFKYTIIYFSQHIIV